ncbi:MAG: metalloregulator ArsR/SmtB family transcription factor [Candidatus Fermentibacteraceae bacterium]
MERDARLFKVLSDLTRLKIMVILTVSGETCVCRLTEALGVSESTASRHLGVLRTHGIVKARRQGTWMHYSLLSPPTGALEHLIPYFVTGLSTGSEMTQVLEKLKKSSCETGRRTDG